MNKGLILSSVDWCNILSGPILNIYFLYLECSLNLERDALYLDNAQHHNLSDRIRVYILKRESKISHPTLGFDVHHMGSQALSREVITYLTYLPVCRAT